MKAFMIRTVANSFTYALAGIIVATITILCMKEKVMSINWGCALMLFAVGLVMLASLMVITSENAYRDERRRATINIMQWAVIGFFCAGIVVALINVTWMVAAIFGLD